MNFLLLLFSFLLNIRSDSESNEFEDENHDVEHKKPVTRVLAYSSSGTKSNQYQGPADSSVVTLLNSSTAINSLVFSTAGMSVARVNYNSNLWSSYCRIVINEQTGLSAFICNGEILIEGLEIYAGFRVGNIIESSGDEDYRLNISSSLCVLLLK